MARRSFPALLLNFLLLWAGVTFGLWVSYILLLGPVWGEHLKDLASLISDRADYLTSVGGSPHPILSVYSDLTFWDRWRCGSLLGALFFALPLALSGAFVESVCRLGKGSGLQWALRLCLAIVWVWYQGGLIHHFAISPWTALYGWTILLLLPVVFGEGLHALLLNWKSRFPKGSRWKSALIPTLILLPILLHPVWDLFLFPRHQDLDQKFGEGTSGSIRLTTARDWLLLDEEGKGLFNSWYYGSAPILMERDRVTVFQPMVVALVGGEFKAWRSWLGVHFATKSDSGGQPIHFFEAESSADLAGPLFRDQLDYVILDASLVNDNLTENWPEGSYCYFSRGIWREADGKLRHDKRTFRAKAERFNNRIYFHTPLVQQRDQIRAQGLSSEQTELALHFKSLLFQILSSPVWIGALGLFGGIGFLVFLAWVLSPLARSRPSLLPFIGLLLSLLQAGVWVDAFQFRIAREGEGFWNQHEALKRASFTLTPSDVETVLQQPKSDDARLRILQWLVVGRAYPMMPDELKAQIVEALTPEIERYSNLPFSQRYKLLDACSQVAPLRPALKEKVQKERHPYVRWYGRDKGFDEI